MLVKAHIRAVTDVSQSADKPMHKVSVETEAPLEIIEFRCFGQDVSNGNVAKLQSLLGKTAMLPLTVDEYKGKAQIKLSFGEVIQTAAPVSKAS